MGGQAAGYIRGAEALGYQARGRDLRRGAQARPAPVQGDAGRGAKVHEGNGDKDGQSCIEPARLYANQRETDETVDEYRDRVRAAIAEDPERYYQRGLVVRLEAQLAEADAELWQLGQTLREHHRLAGAAQHRRVPALRPHLQLLPDLRRRGERR
jgi:hypothetical protein